MEVTLHKESCWIRTIRYWERATGIVYDVRTRFHLTPNEDEHHVENPRRVQAIYEALVEEGLIDLEDLGIPIQGKLLNIAAKFATREQVTLVHKNDHYDFIMSTKDMDKDMLKAITKITEKENSIYFCNLSYMSSLLSAGGAIEACSAILDGKVKNAIALTRPPGHHAQHDKAQGFCLFNNISIATKFIQSRMKSGYKVMIFDWDVHHGDGIQNAHYDDPNVLYISLHVFHSGIGNDNFYPGKSGDPKNIGRGEGIGKNINVGWMSQGMHDGDYLYAFHQIVMSAAYEFDPDFVFVAAGFDAAEGDELGGCHVTPACYAQMTHMLMSLANGKVAVCLEGGYNLHALSTCALAVTQVLMGDVPPRPNFMLPSPTGVRAVETTKEAHFLHWRSFRPIGESHIDEL
ncbi:MAG: Histone deacetylase hda1 [Trizodia sp. TS-e1964]|nr:MAG: Histone deacetylase hda1 [Trizodia sp. TS-e1964]